MAIQYFCGHEERKNKVRLVKVQSNGIDYNGIDYLEVADEAQLTLQVRFLQALTADAVQTENIRVEGGARIRNVKVKTVSIAGDMLIVAVDRPGDYSPYILRLVQGVGSDTPPTWVDPVLSWVEFSFKVACPSDFDCKQETKCPPEALPEPEIDYLAKDYGSFRRLMLDRLSVTMGQWKERNPADIGIAAVETLAYAADRLSYFQDAVASEAYLGTARRRVSVRRHARLLDYVMHDGCNARAWVVMEFNGGAGYYVLHAHTPLLTGGVVPEEVVVRSSRISVTLLAGEAQVFETMHDITLRTDHNRIEFYTWGDENCCLPRGATRASLKNERNALQYLKKGDLLLFEEVAGTNGRPEDADVSHRHIVRLTGVETVNDPVYEKQVLNIEWAPEDALPFPLCLHVVDILVDPLTGRTEAGPVGIARGNVVLADHGRTFCDEALIPEEVLPAGRYHPRLPRTDITFRVPYDDETARTQPAGSMLIQDPREALADVDLMGNDDPWSVRRDLLESDRFAPEFVVETEEDDRAYLRFGDNILGKQPSPGVAFHATFRVGNGTAGNVGAETITQVVLAPGEGDIQKAISLRNPLPAQGGTEPESIEQVRLYAPQAFRTQRRAVTPADFVDMVQRHPEVQRAVAIQRWTGSWHTVFITVDRTGGRTVDEEFKKKLKAFLEDYRMMGHDLEIEAPRQVALDIALQVCVAAEHQRVAVKASLQETFSSGLQSDGRRGFFHPDNFTFGQHVYLSQVVAAAMQVPGVEWVAAERFQRWGQPPQGEREAGVIRMSGLEITRLDNDPNAPENGRIDFVMQGGL